MRIIKRTIIGVTLCLGLIVQTANVHAIYSPTISKRVSVIKQHINTARQHNGTGTITAAIESVKAQDDKRAKEGKARALPAEAALVIPKILGYMFVDLIKAPLDPIYMIFNIIPSTGAVVSTCLRNDIWILEDLRDVVAQEMIKAYLMMDSNNGDLLSNDYDYLRNHIKILKESGHRPEINIRMTNGTIKSSSEYFFGVPSAVNYYSIKFPTETEVESTFSIDECTKLCQVEKCNQTCKTKCTTTDDKGSSFIEKVTNACETIECNTTCKEEDCQGVDSQCVERCTAASKITLGGCPESDFVEAFKEVGESIKNLKTLSSGSGSDWGSILVMAQAQARRRAEEWIKTNQITFTLGGKEGGNAQSLVKGDNWKVFVGQFNTQMKILKNMIGPLTPLFSWSIYSKGSEKGDEASYGCMYYHADIGVFRACTVEQLKDYLICRERKKYPEAEETEEIEVCGKKIPKEKEEAIDCNKFRNPYVLTTPVETVENHQEEMEEHQKTITTTKRVLKYNTNLNSVSEQSLIEMDAILWEINKEIGRSFEADGDEAGKSLPYIYSNLSTFIKKHCGGKHQP